MRNEQHKKAPCCKNSMVGTNSPPLKWLTSSPSTATLILAALARAWSMDWKYSPRLFIPKFFLGTYPPMRSIGCFDCRVDPPLSLVIASQKLKRNRRMHHGQGHHHHRRSRRHRIGDL